MTVLNMLAVMPLMQLQCMKEAENVALASLDSGTSGSQKPATLLTVATLSFAV